MHKRNNTISLLFLCFLSTAMRIESYNIVNSAKKTARSIKRNISKQWYYITGATVLCVSGYLVSRMIKHRESPLIDTESPSTQEKTKLATGNNGKFKKQLVIIPREDKDDTNLELELLLSQNDINLSDFKLILNGASNSNQKQPSKDASLPNTSTGSMVLRTDKENGKLNPSALLKICEQEYNKTPKKKKNRNGRGKPRKKKSRMQQALASGD